MIYPFNWIIKWLLRSEEIYNDVNRKHDFASEQIDRNRNSLLCQFENRNSTI